MYYDDCDVLSKLVLKFIWEKCEQDTGCARMILGIAINHTYELDGRFSGIKPNELKKDLNEFVKTIKETSLNSIDKGILSREASLSQEESLPKEKNNVREI